MNNQTANNSITISKKTIQRQGGFVILPLRKYEELLREKAIPTYYLKGKEAEELDKLVEEGLEDYRKGKCKTIKSLADLK
jgi:hypothetical protein